MVGQCGVRYECVGENRALAIKRREAKHERARGQAHAARAARAVSRLEAIEEEQKRRDKSRRQPQQTALTRQKPRGKRVSPFCLRVSPQRGPHIQTEQEERRDRTC